MTFFLRDKNNITLADIDLWVKREDEDKYIEISSTIPIDAYSKFLLHVEQKDQQEGFLRPGFGDLAFKSQV